ncbi:N-glycosylase/DNA lyase [Candidatus Bathyarchaeota archaeon]|nr:N-glycosylase/DNA lyase [Candidatus Bathyarchaeota archaeon]MBT4320196.1 N-glycosylase/DNA lyase [Candidatus Bathyarchaeota archaeon]MBT4423365.1 N-glycosylase/DNA lyase [Candidatus Bathyarchaeota archaeon]MBT6603941.1 N-glycosylase/DNA lyase [Candidatus Bathyarchaeota archaeon]MBT7186304.1 N-glycosylase/DNA lyase [Candidatus Bathyarchaeota archaeon]
MKLNLDNLEGIIGLVERVNELRRVPRVKKMVEDRMEEFRQVHEMDTFKWYEELVYCLLTAYASAAMGQKCVDALCNDNVLLEGSEEDIRLVLVETGHRFPNKRSEYIFNTRALAPSIKETILRFDDSKEARAWLVKNVKGIGWKEGSHYLRNIGYFDLAIIDRHILNNLREFDLLDEDGMKGLTRKRYLTIEEMLDVVAEKLQLDPGELDLYMWYRKTGKVLK